MAEQTPSADGLRTTVQKMIDDGADESTIATVVRRYREAMPGGKEALAAEQKAKNDALTAANAHPVLDASEKPFGTAKAFLQGAYEGSPNNPLSGGPKDIVEGAKAVYHGVMGDQPSVDATGQPQSRAEQAAGGVNRAVKGVLKPIALPLTVAAVANPVVAGAGLVAGTVADMAGNKVARMAGAGPEVSQLAGNAVALPVGAVASEAAAAPEVNAALKAGTQAFMKTTKVGKMLTRGKGVVDAMLDAYHGAKPPGPLPTVSPVPPGPTVTPVTGPGVGPAGNAAGGARPAGGVTPVAGLPGSVGGGAPAGAPPPATVSPVLPITPKSLPAGPKAPLQLKAAPEPAQLPSVPPAAAPKPEDVVASYAQKAGLEPPAAHESVKVKPTEAMKIADAYEAMPHTPNDPAVKASYDALGKEISAQYDHLIDSGVKVEKFTGDGEPYPSSKAMMNDVRKNGHLFYKPTGTEISADHPLAAVDANGVSLNDKLRAVHDYFAHATGGHSFGPNGEENAWLEHLKTLSPEAQKALTTETRGQNSWVNYGPQMRAPNGQLLKAGEAGYRPPNARAFAQQKAGLLPDSLTKPE